METVSVASYGGIFKFVRTEKAKAHFLRARVLISENKFFEAEEEFLKANTLCEDREDANVVDIVLHEVNYYLKGRIPHSTKRSDDVDWAAVITRRPERLDEALDRIPQGLFMARVQRSSGIPLVLAGRKSLSQLWLQNLIPEIFCSQIRPDMLLGLMADWRVTDSKVVVFYRPIDPGEKLAVFHDLLATTSSNDVELVFPFPLIKPVTRKEFTSPPEGWDVDANFDHSLSHGEEHIRQVTVDLLRRLGLTSHLLYDPACSTGVFLNALKQAFPDCTTVGQDLSRKMCDVARDRVDTVHCGSALKPLISPGTADCVFVRFLNSEVVTSEEAELLLSSLLPTVKVGGVMVTFGHTPVLLSSSYFDMLPGFERLGNVAASKDASCLFQYYVVRRVGL